MSVVHHTARCPVALLIDLTLPPPPPPPFARTSAIQVKTTYANAYSFAFETTVAFAGCTLIPVHPDFFAELKKQQQQRMHVDNLYSNAARLQAEIQTSHLRVHATPRARSGVCTYAPRSVCRATDRKEARAPPCAVTEYSSSQRACRMRPREGTRTSCGHSVAPTRLASVRFPDSHDRASMYMCRDPCQVAHRLGAMAQSREDNGGMTAAQATVERMFANVADTGKHGTLVVTFRDDDSAILYNRQRERVFGFKDRVLKVQCAMEYFGAFIHQRNHPRWIKARDILESLDRIEPFERLSLILQRDLEDIRLANSAREGDELTVCIKNYCIYLTLRMDAAHMLVYPDIIDAITASAKKLRDEQGIPAYRFKADHLKLYFSSLSATGALVDSEGIALRTEQMEFRVRDYGHEIYDIQAKLRAEPKSQRLGYAPPDRSWRQELALSEPPELVVWMSLMTAHDHPSLASDFRMWTARVADFTYLYNTQRIPSTIANAMTPMPDTGNDWFYTHEVLFEAIWNRAQEHARPEVTNPDPRDLGLPDYIADIMRQSRSTLLLGGYESKQGQRDRPQLFDVHGLPGKGSNLSVHTVAGRDGQASPISRFVYNLVCGYQRDQAYTGNGKPEPDSISSANITRTPNDVLRHITSFAGERTGQSEHSVLLFSNPLSSQRMQPRRVAAAAPVAPGRWVADGDAEHKKGAYHWGRQETGARRQGQPIPPLRQQPPLFRTPQGAPPPRTGYYNADEAAGDDERGRQARDAARAAADEAMIVRLGAREAQDAVDAARALQVEAIGAASRVAGERDAADRADAARLAERERDEALRVNERRRRAAVDRLYPGQSSRREPP